MDKNMETPVSNLKFKAMLPKKERLDGVLAFGELTMCDDAGNEVFKARGFRIRMVRYEKSHGSKLDVDFPAYKTAFGFQKSFIAEGDNYPAVKKGFIEAYCEASGGLTVEDLVKKFEVIPETVSAQEVADGIPF